jgi:hypothetical protein
MNDMPDPNDWLRRGAIQEYRRMAEGAKKEAADTKNTTHREYYLALAKSLIELAESLQDLKVASD